MSDPTPKYRCSVCGFRVYVKWNKKHERKAKDHNRIVDGLPVHCPGSGKEVA